MDNFQLLNNTIHDFELTVDNSIHSECIRSSGTTAHPVEGLIIRGNKFWDCEIYALSLTGIGPNAYIENNWFGGSEHGMDNPPQNDNPRGTSYATGETSSVTGPIYIRFNSFQTQEGLSPRGLVEIRHPTPTTSSGTSSASADVLRTSPTATTSTTTLAPVEARGRSATFHSCMQTARAIAR